jgi:hypothetical protein
MEQVQAEMAAWKLADGNFDLVTICPNFGEPPPSSNADTQRQPTFNRSEAWNVLFLRFALQTRDMVPALQLKHSTIMHESWHSECGNYYMDLVVVMCVVFDSVSHPWLHDGPAVGSVSNGPLKHQPMQC